MGEPALEVRSRIAVKRFRPHLEENVEDNASVLEALKAGDGVRAGKYLRKMIESFLARER